jgi:tetratricopeptide (TPR) repeat protein
MADVAFVADDFAAWLIGALADAGRKKLVTLVLGSDQERALRAAATAAVARTAAELCPGDEQRAGQLAMVVSEVFADPLPADPLAGQKSLLEALGAGIGAQLAVLDDASLTGTGQSSAHVLGVTGGMVVSALTGHLIREIASRGARDMPLFPLASQLNHDATHLQGQRLEDMLGQLAGQVRAALARLDAARGIAAPTALAQLPLLAAGFTGRGEELAVLDGLLDPTGGSGPVLVSAVAGLAGVGKTTLAIAAGHAAVEQGWFGGGVLFVDLHGYDDKPVDPGQALDALLRALGVPAEHIPPGTEERAGLYRSVLGQIGEPVLVIADNASSEAQVRPLLPGTGPHRVLVTSRHTLAGLGARLVDITVLDQDTSVALLHTALHAARPADDRISDQPEQARRLASVCGGLPLALQITAALLTADPALTAADLADSLAAESARLEQLAYNDGSGADAPSVSVAAAFGLSYRKLDHTTARMFRLLAVNPGPDISTAAVSVLADLPAGQARTVLGHLAQAHLAEPTPRTPGRWRMHDLVRLYAQQLADEHAEGDGREQARDRLLGYYLDTADAADDHLHALPGTAVPERFTGREEALAWLDGERTSLVAASAMATATGRDQAAVRLPLLLAEYLQWRRRFDDWLAVTAISLDAARRLGDRHYEAAALTILGHALNGLRRFQEAITAYLDSAALFRDTGNRQGEAAALNNLGNALQGVRRFQEAITAHQDAATIYRDTGDRHGEAGALSNLGNALNGVRRFQEAITAHQDAATIYRDTGDRHRQAVALNNLGVALRQVRRFQEAITAHHDAAAIFRDTGDRHGEGTALGNLGNALQGVRRFQEAITAHQDAATIYRDTGDRHRQAGALGNLGNALQEIGRFQEAITTCQDAAAIFRDTGDRHRQAGALGNLGNALRQAGRFQEAITACQEAAAIFRDTGDRHGEGTVLYNLGLALRAVHRLGEAIIAYQDAVVIYEETGDQYRQGIVLEQLEEARLAQRA